VIEERTRPARDLHDAVSQKLFGIRVKARAAAILVPKDPAGAAAELESVAELGVEAYAELRAVIDGLLPPDLTTHSLADSVRRYAEVAGRAHGRQVYAGDLPCLGAAADEVLYRVAQEALHNALRHSGTREVRVHPARPEDARPGRGRGAGGVAQPWNHGQGADPDQRGGSRPGRACRGGGAGYLYKDVDPEALVRAIRTAADGNVVLAPAAAGPFTGPPAGQTEAHGASALTGRERQVLALLARGTSNREIARALGVSEKTVKTHVSSVFAKLGVQDRTQAALYAVRRGLVGT
jgi:DNA-binding CsgD family transcriptional regulator